MTVRQYTIDEVEQNNTEKRCWFVINAKVYDATPFLKEVCFFVLLEIGSAC